LGTLGIGAHGHTAAERARVPAPLRPASAEAVGWSPGARRGRGLLAVAAGAAWLWGQGGSGFAAQSAVTGAAKSLVLCCLVVLVLLLGLVLLR